MCWFLPKFSFSLHTSLLAKLCMKVDDVYNSEWQRESSMKNESVKHEGKLLRLNKAHNKIQWRGEGIGSWSNNLVYTKRQKDILFNSTHETTQIVYFFLLFCLNGHCCFYKFWKLQKEIKVQFHFSSLQFYLQISNFWAKKKNYIGSRAKPLNLS